MSSPTSLLTTNSIAKEEAPEGLLITPANPEKPQESINRISPRINPFNGIEDEEDYSIWESSSSNVSEVGDVAPDITNTLSVCQLPLEQVNISKNVEGMDMGSDCFISHIEYNIKENQMKYVLCPDLDYTDSDFEEDSKNIVNDLGDSDEDDCCIVDVECNQVTNTENDSSKKRLTSSRLATICDEKHSCTDTSTSQNCDESSTVSSAECVKQEGFTSPDDTLFQQYTTKGGKKCLVCEVCERIFRHRYNLMRHMETHTGVQMKIFRCNKCPETFDRIYLLEEHRQKHEDSKHTGIDMSHSIQSTQSKKSEKNTQRVRRETRERCRVCGVWGTARALSLHTANHLAGKTFICHWCQEGFYTCSQLNHHMKTHVYKTTSRYHYKWTKPRLRATVSNKSNPSSVQITDKLKNSKDVKVSCATLDVVKNIVCGTKTRCLRSTPQEMGLLYKSNIIE